ncbi:urate hydroxylase PuuD [Flavobacterium sp.]|uniref:urate hydroxylase PuuD n=1 Tax=Flavobacterium sp. TaxID=239 RepID=UPI0026364686|nr:urate hydroxylase PuuD [Flavobacterium sp.]
MKVNIFILLVLYAVYFGILITLGYLSYKMPGFRFWKSKESSDDDETIKTTSLNYMYTGMLFAILGILVNTYLLVLGTPLESHMMEWLNIVIRLMHITFGIAWIGASFYFVFLENALNRTENVRDELAGNLWAVHGGGFYYVEKYKIAPKEIPKHLHWFKYEAYFTWLSGFCLLFVVYYFNASALLIDKNVLDITATQGILIGIGSFVVSWLIYDLMCKSRLIKNQLLFSIVGFLILIAFAAFYCHVFSSRAAYIHFGAMIGGIMVANVFFVIIPAQKAMVHAAKMGLPLDPTLGKNALARSLHNNYFTLPVLFVMVSNHFPSTFGYEYPWLILAVISLGAAGVKHYLNLKEKKQLNVWILPVSVVILLAACFISAPTTNPYECKKEVSFTEVNAIIQKRCTQCHSANPTDDVYKIAPNGVMYDTPEDILKKKDLIMQRVVVTKTMPQNNKTNITQEERDMIRCWIEQGASLK